MTDIDKLLQEAKPLYFKRKRSRRIGAAFSALFACCFAWSITFYSSNKTLSPIYDIYNDEIYQAELGSIIEDLGLPVDEFGLLLV